MTAEKSAPVSRKDQILQALAQMLESKEGSQRITTVKLAAHVGISDAALYRHFPSKMKMFDDLIGFIEDTIITRINLIIQEEKNTLIRIQKIIKLLLLFAEKNPGLTRVMTGHALMFEEPQLQTRVNQLFAKIETQLRQVLRERKLREGVEFKYNEELIASQLMALCEGMMLRFVRSEFYHRPTLEFDARWQLIATQLI